MIKINLLSPERPKKNRKKIRLQVQMIWGLLTAGAMVFLWFFALNLFDEQLGVLQVDHSALTTELSKLKLKVKEVENYEEDRKKVNEKILIIQRLRKNQSIPVHLLDEVSKSLPDRVWLLSLSEKSGSVDLSGKATSNSEIVDFANNLKAETSFENVQILETRQRKEENITIYSFRLQWSILS